MFTFSHTRRPSRKSTHSRKRRLAFLPLEERAMMAGIPQLSSLPGAAQTIYLDFDGDTQQTWNRTDSNQTYTNVVAGEFNTDNTAGISTAEEAAIRKIWETVADDYAPFNVNVTTVAPASFADRVGLRVVMCGDTSATLTTSAGKTFNSGTRNVFISDDQGVMADNSGYAAIDSYTNAEPNVVYVFAKYISTWGTIDNEGRYRDLRAVMATTATHEAGHAFGLEHHGNNNDDYDKGTIITTPIMGSNVEGDRSLWSSYTVGTTAFDSVARLTTLFGARADDYFSTASKAVQFPLTYSAIYGWTGMVSGVIGTTIDVDTFRFTTSSTNTYKFTVTVPQFGNLDAQLMLYKVNTSWIGTTMQLMAVVDPAIHSLLPFSGLGATLTTTLDAGTWAIAVRSHGSYGDIGNYTLTATIPSSQPNVDIGGTVSDGGTTTTTTTTKPRLPTSPRTETTKGGGAGGDVGQIQPVSRDAKATLEPLAIGATSRKQADLALVDDIFAAWPAALERAGSETHTSLKR